MNASNSDTGFTLVEVLIATAILSIIALAGSQAITNSVLAQNLVLARQDNQRDLERLMGLLRADLDHRITLDGRARTQFDPVSQTLTFTRSGLLLAERPDRRAYGQVAWRMLPGGEGLIRQITPTDSVPAEVELFEGVSFMRVAILDGIRWQTLDTPTVFDITDQRGLRVSFDVAGTRSLQIVSAR